MTHSAPPQRIEKIVGLLIPPAAREEVLGDLHERCVSNGQYILEALQVLPMVVASRIRRTADMEVLLMAFVVAYLSYMGAAWFLDRASFGGNLEPLRLAVPPLMVLVGAALEDAYAKPGARSPLRPLRGPVLGLAIAYLSQIALGTMSLPRWTWLYGSALALPLTSALRVLFPPVADRAAGASGPAFFLKQAGGSAPVANEMIKGLGVIVVAGLIGALIGVEWIYRMILISTVLMIFFGARRGG